MLASEPAICGCAIAAVMAAPTPRIGRWHTVKGEAPRIVVACKTLNVASVEQSNPAGCSDCSKPALALQQSNRVGRHGQQPRDVGCKQKECASILMARGVTITAVRANRTDRIVAPTAECRAKC